MKKYSYSGSCHCDNINFIFGASKSCDVLERRICDCQFCIKQGASYLSDPNGSLSIKIKAPENIISYTQGADLASFIICKCCGVLTATTYKVGNKLYGAVNASALDDCASFLLSRTISPRALPPEEKKRRWSEMWIPAVTITYAK